MPLRRGAVYFTDLELTPRGLSVGRSRMQKYIVVLQDLLDPTVTNFAFVVCSSDRTGGGLRTFEARLDVEDGFARPTKVDGRWVFTLPRDAVTEEEHQFDLSSERMAEIDLAVFIGLQLEI